MKHIALRMLALQEWCANKRLKFAQVHTDENESDMSTKPMTKERMIELATKLGLSVGNMRSTTTSDGLEQQRRQEALKICET